MKNLIPAFLGILLTASLISCGSEEPLSPGSNTAADTGTVPTETEEADPRAEYADLAPKAEDFDNYEYRIVSINNTAYDYPLFWVDGESGETMNDAIYKRNRAVEERCNVDISYIEMSDTGRSVTTKITADEDFTDIIFNFYTRDLIGLIQSGSMLDVKQLDNLNLSAPWWDQRVLDADICGKLYYLTGDISYFDDLTEMCVIYTKTLYNEHDFEDPYTLVTKGKWTLDRMYEMGRVVSKDLNNDGRMSVDDQWGIVSELSGCWYLFLGSGESSLSKADGRYSLGTGNDRFYTAIDKILNMYADNNTVMPINSGKYDSDFTTASSGDEAEKITEENRLLFRTSTFGETLRLRDMETDFGILPIPKYSEEQDGYYCMESYMCRPLSIPTTVRDPERTALITEQLAYESMFTVSPTFYNVFLSEKILRDPQSLEMVDIMFSSKVYDLDFWFDLTGFPSAIQDMVKNAENTLASTIASLEKSATKKLGTMNDTIDALES